MFADAMRIVVLDDHVLFRESLAMALWHAARIRVVGEASTSHELLALVGRKRPDVAVVDLGLAGESGLAAIRALVRHQPRIPALVLTAHANKVFVKRALQAGALGYALKDQPLVELKVALEACQAGNPYLAPALGALVAERAAGTVESHPTVGIEQLSRRQRQVFEAIVRGLSNRQIGRALGIGLRTVESHRLQLNRKLGTHSTADLVALGALEGLLPRRPSAS